MCEWWLRFRLTDDIMYFKSTSTYWCHFQNLHSCVWMTYLSWPSLNIYLNTSLQSWTGCLILRMNLYSYPWNSCFLTDYYLHSSWTKVVECFPAMPVLMGPKGLQLHDKWVIPQFRHTYFIMQRRRETAVKNPYSLGRDSIIEIFQLKYKMNTYINICQGIFFSF